MWKDVRARCVIAAKDMFARGGPTFLELCRQALSSTERGYDLLAPKFDVTPFRTPDELLDFAVRAIGQATSALDICCGTGAGIQVLRPICRDRVVGLDFSAGMIEQARRNLAASTGKAKIDFVEADVMRMEFCEDFDLATCFGGLGHIQPGQELAFLRLVCRALVPGGRFVFYSGYQPPVLSWASILLRSFNAAMRVRNALLKPPFIMYYFNFLLPETADSLRTLGCEIEVRPGPYGRHHLVIATKRV